MNSECVSGTGSGTGLSGEQTSRVIRILEEYLGKLEQGCPPDADELLAGHPELSDVLRVYLDKLALLHNAATGLRNPNQAEEVAPAALLPERGRLGDFRILREVGRGGMGVVYEAEQISLGRRVALKVLPFTTALDSKQLQRFKKEAQAAAQLHHTHIVPVHFVGVDRGVHYYAMQFIEGQTLAAMITELRQLAGVRRAEPTAIANNLSRLNGSKTLTRAAANKTPARNGNGLPVPVDDEANIATRPPATFITRRSTRSPAFFRTAARLGIQAAEALEHAHQMGVVHRDIKPANLLVDARSHVWVTDFGLALYQSENGLTLTGDVLGTLRYMSPEQAMAKRFLVDHRTDVYSLGVTLYELVTLEPAYNGRDRQELLKQIAFEEPRPPRQVNPAIPVELETVVLKAMAKELDERYTTAQELADDLRRFLENKPILARRPTISERFTKWCRRHRAVVLTALGLFVLALGALLTFMVLLIQEKNKTEAAYKQTLVKEAEARAKEVEAYEFAQKAEKNFQSVCMGVAQPLKRLQDEEWNEVPGIEHIRRALREQSVRFLTEFLKEEKSPDPRARVKSARVYGVIARVHRLYRDIDQSATMYHKAIEIYKGLSEQFPDNREYQHGLAIMQHYFGIALHESGRVKDAAAQFSKAVESYRASLPNGTNGNIGYDSAMVSNDFAWLLATCPIPEYRDTKEAVTLARQALDAVAPYDCPDSRKMRGLYTNTLGVALYRAGNMQAAIEALNRSVELRQGGDCMDWYFLAMAYGRKGDNTLGLKWYKKAVQQPPATTELDLPLELVAGYRLEAEEVLGLKAPSKPKEKANFNSN